MIKSWCQRRLVTEEAPDGTQCNGRSKSSSVQRWRALYEEHGELGLRPLERGRSEWKASDEVREALVALMDSSPSEHGYLRSRWSSELLAIELQRRTGVQVHATTVRRWLKRLGFGYRRARPTLCIRDQNKLQCLEVIAETLVDGDPDCEVFYADEADIDLNPRIGPAWMARGRQSMIPTPGKNQKYYLVGALNARTGKSDHEGADGFGPKVHGSLPTLARQRSCADQSISEADLRSLI